MAMNSKFWSITSLFQNNFFCKFKHIPNVKFSYNTAGLKEHQIQNDHLYGLTNNEHKFRETVSEFCKEEILPFANEIDCDDSFPSLRDFLKKAGSMGILGITAPCGYGGMEESYLKQIIACEEISRASPSVGLSYGAHANLCVNQIVRNASSSQKKKFLPRLIKGELLGALAMSEVNAGSDVVSMKCKAEFKGDHFVLNGTKFWITNGPDADIIIVYAKTSGDNDKPTGVTAFIVEKDMPRFSRGKKLDKLGIRGSGTGELIFQDCFVPCENVLGEVNKGIYVLFSGLDIERLVLAAGPIGIMQSCCDVAFEYVHKNKDIATSQLNQGKMADMYTRLSVSRAYLYSIARALDKGLLSSRDCAAVALFTSEAATRTSQDALQLLGCDGYTTDYPTGRFFRDSKLFEIGGGTTEIRRILIARSISNFYKTL